MATERLKRRNFIKKVIFFGGALTVTPTLLAKQLLQSDHTKEEDEVSPNEDLMREHGVLRRIILIYREVIARIENDIELDPGLINNSARIVRNFIENYHEKLEENFIFPRFEIAGKLIGLVETLKTQHQAGRSLTTHVLDATQSPSFKSQRQHLVQPLSEFIHMYEPHAAREDTVLFPAFHKIVSQNEYKELGEQFEEEEHKLFGKEGFREIVSHVEKIEKALGIYSLSEFTPK